MSICQKHPGHMTQAGCTGFVSVTPSPGWHAEWDAPDGTEASKPLVGWGIQCNGEVVPLEADVDGFVAELAETSRCVYIDPATPLSMGLAEIAMARR